MNQNDVMILVEHTNDVNSAIKAPLQSTQRIKFTCFDVSPSYIVFGATSGGVYIYNRHPYAFVKLIPNKYGSIVQVSIAPNESTVALTNAKGLVVIIENCQTESNFQYQVYSEHFGSLVTAFQWHNDDLYCGDDKGKISVISMPNLLSKTIFQTPCASLMCLDSSVVQIDCYSKYLLISTLTRTYLCDTEKEQFKQIGKKLRDGPFGACFFVPPETNENKSFNLWSQSSSSAIHTGLFKKVTKEDDEKPAVPEGTRIFCSRPGARMWEAHFDASVSRTHQFKNFLMQEPSRIMYLDEDDPNAWMKTDWVQPQPERGSEQFHFGKVLMLDAGKFCLAFNKFGFYIFEPIQLRVLCWSDQFGLIDDVKIVRNFVYIQSARENVGKSFEIRVVALYELEKLVLKTLFNKQYYLCGEICADNSEELIRLSFMSNKLHLLSVLKEKLSETSSNELLKQLQPVFEALQRAYDDKFSNRKPTTGIVVVNNPHVTMETTNENVTSEKQQSLKGKLTEGTKNLKQKLQILEATVKSLTYDDSEPQQHLFLEDLAEEDPITEQEPNTVETTMKIFTRQYEWTKLNEKVETSKFTELLASNSLNDNVKLFRDFIEFTLVDETKLKQWTYNQFLKYLSKLNPEQLLFDSEDTFRFSFDAFCAVNKSVGHGCPVCFYPLPSAQHKIPEYHEVGHAVLKHCWRSEFEREQILKGTPYMWKYAVEELAKDSHIDSLLPLLVQFGDEDLISKSLNRFKYDTWDEAVRLLIKLKKGTCLNCDGRFENNPDRTMSWSRFGKLMLKPMGGASTINLLMGYSSFINAGELDHNFYQACIFMTGTDDFGGDNSRNEALSLCDKFQSNSDMAIELDQLIGKYLQTLQKRQASQQTKNCLDITRCSFCNLPMDLPLLRPENSGKKLKNCDHLIYHPICSNYQADLTCEKCKNVQETEIK